METNKALWPNTGFVPEDMILVVRRGCTLPEALEESHSSRGYRGLLSIFFATNYRQQQGVAA
jgi:hypothetical protein